MKKTYDPAWWLAGFGACAAWNASAVGYSCRLAEEAIRDGGAAFWPLVLLAVNAAALTACAWCGMGCLRDVRKGA